MDNLCGAKTRSSGEPCKRRATPGRKRCNLHGGKSLQGLAVPGFKTGRYSKSLPVRLAARYNEAQTDAKLLELRDEIALIDARIGELLGRLNSNESGRAWLATGTAFDNLNIAMRKDDAAEIIKQMAALQNAIDLGRTDTLTWSDLQETIEQRRRLVESERKHLSQMEQLVSVQEMMVMAGALLASVKAHVSDRNALGAISADFSRLVNIEN